jgi:RNA polymerase sigma-70 factor (ECF subfamily)
MITKEAFTSAFEASRAQLSSYLLRITTNEEDAADVVQETYLKAHQKLATFREESSIKTWIFAIATNIARDQQRSKNRWPEEATDLCRTAALSNPAFLNEMGAINQTSPQGQFEIREHIAFCFTCISKSLPIEQQLVILLKEVYSFKVKEVATVLETTEAMVKYYLREGRGKMMGVFDRRCSLINKEGACHQCSELNGMFNPKQQLQEELMKIELARTAQEASKEKLFDLRMNILKELDPFESDGADLQLRHLKHNHELMNKKKEKK